MTRSREPDNHDIARSVTLCQNKWQLATDNHDIGGSVMLCWNSWQPWQKQSCVAMLESMTTSYWQPRHIRFRHAMLKSLTKMTDSSVTMLHHSQPRPTSSTSANNPEQVYLFIICTWTPGMLLSCTTSLLHDSGQNSNDKCFQAQNQRQLNKA